MNTYYIDHVNGNDSLDGLSAETARQNYTDIDVQAGDKVLFKCGSFYRDKLHALPHVSYGAYGEGDKPTIYGALKNAADDIEISLPVNKDIEEIEIEAIDRKKKKQKEEQPKVKAKLNFVLTTYYKGTGMEEVLKKLEQYVDNADKNENDITCI